MFAKLCLLLTLVSLLATTQVAGIHCLVSRPGKGLISEKCVDSAVACRISIDETKQHAITFYPWSPIYDRNQFVCVMPHEYNMVGRSGCVQKRSGRVKCWCYGRSNCNSVENSKALYEAFRSGNSTRLESTIQELDFPNIRENEESITAAATTEPTTKSFELTARTTEKPSSQFTAKSQLNEIENKPQRRKNHKHHSHHTTTSTISPETTTTYTGRNRQSVIRIAKVMPRPTEKQKDHVEFMNPIVQPVKHHRQYKTTTQPTTSTEMPSDIKVIHVNSKHAYQNVLGSPEFARAVGTVDSPLTTPAEFQALPTDSMLGRGSIDLNEIKELRHAMEEDGNNDLDKDADIDSLDSDLPMSDSDAAIYLNDKIRESRKKPRNLDDFGNSAYDSDDTLNSASHVYSKTIFTIPFIFVFLFFLFQ
ncbi:hypothetical protein M3Y96_00060500 [Aphelenchoides besseyi]|nr:hypothetical protein M3Y96_00060500 [Aphelenchoides besseyi]